MEFFFFFLIIGLHIGAFYIADISNAEVCFFQCGEVIFYLVVLALQLNFSAEDV